MSLAGGIPKSLDSDFLRNDDMTVYGVELGSGLWGHWALGSGLGLWGQVLNYKVLFTYLADRSIVEVKTSEDPLSSISVIEKGASGSLRSFFLF